MIRKTIFFGIIILANSLFFSCASRKDIVYLQDKDSVGNEVQKNVSFEAPKFKVDDRLTISISSLNAEAARPFNLYLASFNMGTLSSVGQQLQQSYLVDKNGEISFPQLGKIKVTGKNRIELEFFLEEKLKGFLPDVKANVQLVNFRVSVLGEVRQPGEYRMNREKVSIFQALGMAGDLTIHGKRDDIKLMREVNGVVKYYSIDITNKDIISSPTYYLQQNDVIYVSPNKPKVNASASSPTATYIISATGLLITIISILTR